MSLERKVLALEEQVALLRREVEQLRSAGGVSQSPFRVVDETGQEIARIAGTLGSGAAIQLTSGGLTVTLELGTRDAQLLVEKEREVLIRLAMSPDGRVWPGGQFRYVNPSQADPG